MDTGCSGDIRHVEDQLLQEQLKLVASALPFVWMTSYRGRAARQNIQYFENGVRHLDLKIPIRVFMSTWTAAVVITFVPLETIKEAHVREWFATFYEVPLDEAKQRLESFPEWPYDGREAWEVKNEMTGSEVIAKSKELLKKYGVAE